MASIAERLPEIVKWVESNPLIVTLTSGGAIVWLFANLRSIFSVIVAIVRSCISFTVTNTYEDARSGYGGGFNIKLRQMMFNNLLSSTKAIWERTMNLDLSNSVDIMNFEKDSNATSSYESEFANVHFDNGINATSKIVNTYGFSIRVILGKICFVDRSYKLDGQRITMNTTVRVFFASKKKFMKNLEDAINAKTVETLNANGSSNYVSVISDQGPFGQKMKRSLSSIFTKDNRHLELFNSIKRFIDNRDIYKKLNYPYNYCGLLYGVPGSGKTSTILAIASELKRDIKYVNLSQTNACQLLKMFNDNPNGSIYVFEDIDAISYRGAFSRESNDNCKKNDESSNDMPKVFGISLSDLLNITDGLLASDGTICLFTTNHIERLDPAFLRAGRMNASFEFTYMTPEVAKKMVESYLDVQIDGMADGIKPAELQESILEVLLGKQNVDALKSRFCKKGLCK